MPDLMTPPLQPTPILFGVASQPFWPLSLHAFIVDVDSVPAASHYSTEVSWLNN